MHRLLARQLRKLGLTASSTPAELEWADLLDQVSETYQQSDNDRYLLERSMQVSSDEMQALSQQQKASTEGRLQALIDALPDLVFMLDEDGRYLEIVAGNLQDLYLPVSQLKTKLLSDIMSSERADFFLKPIRKSLQENSLQLVEYQLSSLKGDRVYEGRIMPTGLKVNNRRTVLFLARDITALVKSVTQLEYIANHDALTGLPNRVMLENRIVQAIARAKRQNKKAAVMLLDLDRFKQVNDSLGHTAGDELLQVLAQRLKDSNRAEDSVFRFGGDEFVIILEDLTDTVHAGRIANHILTTFTKPVKLSNIELQITASLGITITPDDGNSANELLRHADNAMYAAKEAGRNQFSYYTAELEKESLVYHALESRLRAAINNNEMELHYQPQYRLNDGVLTGFEALVRWPTAEPKYRAPDAFIPVAEMSGLIEPLGLWVIEEVCKQAKNWQQEYKHFGRIGINLSSRQLRNSSLSSQVQQILDKYQLPSSLFEFEITESMVVLDGGVANDNLEAFAAMDIDLAIDDFGTGHSSLINLKRFPLTRLKIDRSFVDGLGEDKNDEAITSASIAMAKQMGYQVVAEGVDTTVQAEFLLKHHCDFVQGYLYAKPMPAKEVEKLLTPIRQTKKLE
jgi:diguanylate cyclase (GGDEF)-like protein